MKRLTIRDESGFYHLRSGPKGGEINKITVVQHLGRLEDVALRPVSRERVEKVWMGEWERIIDPYGKLEGFICKCGTQTYSASNFCPHCGGAKTDEAVEMVMRRLEVLHDKDV